MKSGPRSVDCSAGCLESILTLSKVIEVASKYLKIPLNTNSVQNP